MSVLVLANVLDLDNNPYARLWTQAATDAGVRTRRLSAAALLARGQARPSGVHLQWPEWSVAPPRTSLAVRRGAKLLVLAAVARLRGARVVVTAHNVWSHDARHPRLEKALWTLLGPLTTDLHVLSAAGTDEFLAAHPSFRKAAVHEIPHGNYEPVLGALPGRDEARQALGLPADGRVFATFGVLRRYKGVEAVVDAFRRFPDADARLVVAGRVVDDVLRLRLEAARREDPRVHLIPRFMPAEETVRLIRAADVVALPYTRVLNSGSALMALSAGRPVLVPRTPTFEALRERLGPEWVWLFDDAVDEADLEATRPVAQDARPDLSWCSWETVSGQIGRLWGVERRP